MAYNLIGKIAAAHGLDGRLVLKHNLESKNAFNKVAHIFIEIRRESYIPYFIEEKKAVSHDELLLRLDEIDSVELARTLSGKNVYLEEAVFNQLKPKSVSASMIGFTIVDKTDGALGQVEDIFETPGQVLATVTYKGKEVMIPLVDATIIGVDGVKKIINVDLPEGLLEVYL